MKVSTEQHNDIMIIRVEGRVDAVFAPQLELKVNGCVDAGHQKILLNFADVDYLSSAGMRLLLSVTKKLKSLGEGRLVLSNLSSEVMEVIKMAGFHQILNIVATEEAALSSF